MEQWNDEILGPIDRYSYSYYISLLLDSALDVLYLLYQTFKQSYGSDVKRIGRYVAAL
jgi:hypothetical protein